MPSFSALITLKSHKAHYSKFIIRTKLVRFSSFALSEGVAIKILQILDLKKTLENLKQFLLHFSEVSAVFDQHRYINLF